MRTISASFGALLLYTLVSWEINPPNIEVPSPFQAPTFYLPLFLLALVLLAPNSWTTNKLLFLTRGIFYLIVVVWIVVRVSEAVLEEPDRSLIILCAMVFTIISTSMFTSLVLSRFKYPNYY